MILKLGVWEVKAKDGDKITTIIKDGVIMQTIIKDGDNLITTQTTTKDGDSLIITTVVGDLTMDQPVMMDGGILTAVITVIMAGEIQTTLTMDGERH